MSVTVVDSAFQWKMSLLCRCKDHTLRTNFCLERGFSEHWESHSYEYCARGSEISIFHVSVQGSYLGLIDDDIATPDKQVQALLTEVSYTGFKLCIMLKVLSTNYRSAMQTLMTNSDMYLLMMIGQPLCMRLDIHRHYAR